MRKDAETSGRHGMSHKNETIWSWVFMLPTMIFLGLTALLPLLYSVYLSFFQYKINLPNAVPVFNGLGNYIRMFTDKNLAASTKNTIIFALISVALELFVGIIVAMVFCSDKMWARLCMSILMIPMIMAPVAIGTLWRMMLDGTTGVINYLLGFLGIPGISWLSNPKFAMPAVMLVNVWQLVPWVTIIVAAGLKALPTEVYTMTNGGPGNATEMLPNYIYKQGLKFFDAGYTAALAIMFVIVMTLITALFLKFRKYVEGKVS